MSFNFSGPSFYTSKYFPSSSSSSSDSDDDMLIALTVNHLQVLTKHRAPPSTRRGSIFGHRVINRYRENGARNLFNDYFAANPTFDETMFRRRFRMSRNLFLRIVDQVKAHDTYFVQKRNAAGKIGLSTLQKISAAFRMLAYDVPADSTDEYIRIDESTAIECVKRYFRAVVEGFGAHYFRSPNTNDVARLLHINKQRGFPGMLGSLDCMHWQWKNCPTAWVGQYAGRSGHLTIILEVVADYDLWIWHAYFEMPGSNNDVNVMEVSNLFSNLAQGLAPPANYIIQGKEYDTGYYLADGIYPKWSTLVQTIRDPRGPKKKYFAMKQEPCRKDVERAFGVLKSRFANVKKPAWFWNKQDLHDIMTACIIMHNMIIEDERDMDAPIQDAMEAPSPNVDFGVDANDQFQAFIGRYRQIKDKAAHIALRNALIDHLWDEYINSDN